MTLKPPIGRRGYRSDLTRWNRAGLKRFSYVDGNAAVWLEELRIGMLAQYLRGIDPEDREPEKWRDLFLKPPAKWEVSTSQAEYDAAVAWADILPEPPANTETGGARARRLIDQYDRQSPDYAWEITRAFARAAHVLLGHLDAFANEGYLRTATQWDNLRKLAAMVNYQTPPPASASTTVALTIADDVGKIEITRGLAMKYAPPEGGAPLIFETLKPLTGHPDLNAARAVDWDKNFTDLDISAPTYWIAPDKAALAPGDLAVLSGVGSSAKALALETVEPIEDEGLAKLGFNPSSGISPDLYQASLHTEPEGVRVGLPRTVSSQLVVKLAGASSIPVNTVVEVRYNGGASTRRAVVIGAKGDQLVLDIGGTVTGKVTVEVYTPFAANGDGDFETPTDVDTLYFKPSGPLVDVVAQTTYKTRDENDDYDGDGKAVARAFEKPAGAIGLGYANLVGDRVFDGVVVSAPPSDISISGGPVRFEGKPPKGLKQGDWYVSRPVGGTSLAEHRVTGIRVESDVHYVYFSPQPTGEPNETEFFGPMTRRLRPQYYNRNPADAIVGGECTLDGLSAEARDLVRSGKSVIVVGERGSLKTAGLATVLTREEMPNGHLLLSLDSDTDFTGWEKGWTRFHFNTVAISHGETKDPRALGSGDAEKRRQDFKLKVNAVSFIPSTASVNGVVPDMDVAVDGVKWEYHDFGDPDAEGSDAWSVRLNEDDTLQVHFRRRLPTGSNNVTIPRHRVGVGLRGTGVPAWSFTAPMKKNRFVTAIVHPFATSGGSDREPVTDMRENAPANLAANGRAVALKDFESLARRHSSVWQARAREIVAPGALNRVDVIVVPAGGGDVSPTLDDDLTDYLSDRALPGVEITISGYEDVTVDFTVTARVDCARFDKTDVRDALSAALTQAFALSGRGLGQPFYVAEILAAGEEVTGVETLVVDAFARSSGAPQVLREAQVGGSLAALFPHEEQVVFASKTGVVVKVEAAS